MLFDLINGLGDCVVLRGDFSRASVTVIGVVNGPDVCACSVLRGDFGSESSVGLDVCGCRTSEGLDVCAVLCGDFGRVASAEVFLAL